MYDSYGDGWNGVLFTLMDMEDNIVIQTTFDNGDYAESYFDIDAMAENGLSFSQNNGELSPGEIVELNFNLQTNNYLPGFHEIGFVIYSNDPLNSELAIPVSFSIEPPVMVLSNELTEIDLYSNEIGQQDIPTITNSGSYPLEWGSDFMMDMVDVRDMSNYISPNDFRESWNNELVPIQEQTAEIELDILNHSQAGILVKNRPIEVVENIQTLSQNTILPPEAHRNLNGNLEIVILMDNQYYVWNTMDALSTYFTDYNINELYTNWDIYNLEVGIQDADLVLIPFGHWLDNYNLDEFKSIINNYAENGGGVIYTGYNFNEYGVFEGSYPYTGWCCNTTVNDADFNANHPIMEGIGDEANIYALASAT